MRTLPVVTLAALLALASPASAEDVVGKVADQVSTLAESPRSPFTPGEELIYKVSALGMTAGKMRVSVGSASDRDGVSAWPVVIQARTDSLFDSVYTVRDRFVTWWDPKTGRVVGADFYADEGGRRHRSRSRIDHASGKAEVLRIREWNGHKSTKTYEIPAGSYDIAGALMALRGRPLVPGTVEEIDVFTGRKVFKLRCTVEKLERVKVKAGSFDTVVARIELGFDGQFESKRDVRAWFSNDARHLPVKLEAEFALGSIVAELNQAKAGISR